MKAPNAANQSRNGELLAERAYSALRRQIVSLEIPPGAPISEERLMTEIGVGRTPIREAMKRLALQNLVTVHPGRGTFASDINITDLRSIFDVREVLEPHAARRAAGHRRAVDLEEMEALRARLAEGQEALDPYAAMAVDGEIHRLIYRCARNAFLESTLETYLNLALRLCHYVLDYLPALPTEIAEHHDVILGAIRDGDRERAGEAMAEHIRAFERDIRNAI